MSYSFIGSLPLNTKGSGQKVSVEMWEFGCPEDAFGVFSKDRAGADIKLGNGSALFDNYLFLWNDVYFIKIEPRDGDVLPDEVVFVGNRLSTVCPTRRRSCRP